MSQFCNYTEVFHDSKEILLIASINYLSRSHISFHKEFFCRWCRPLYLVSETAKLSIIHMPCIGMWPWSLSAGVLWLSCYLSESNLLHPILKILLQSICFVIMLEQLWSVSVLVTSPSYCKIISLFIVSWRNKRHSEEWSLRYLNV